MPSGVTAVLEEAPSPDLSHKRGRQMAAASGFYLHTVNCAVNSLGGCLDRHRQCAGMCCFLAAVHLQLEVGK